MKILFNVPAEYLSSDLNSNIGRPLFNESSEFQEKVGEIIYVAAVGNTNLLQVEAQIEDRFSRNITAMLGSGTILFGDVK